MKLFLLFFKTIEFFPIFPLRLLCQYVKEHVERVKSVNSFTGSFERSAFRGKASKSARGASQLLLQRADKLHGVHGCRQ